MTSRGCEITPCSLLATVYDRYSEVYFIVGILANIKCSFITYKGYCIGEFVPSTTFLFHCGNARWHCVVDKVHTQYSNIQMKFKYSVVCCMYLTSSPPCHVVYVAAIFADTGDGRG